MTLNHLTALAEQIYAEMAHKAAIRDTIITRSRELIRHCAESIRATHRREWETAQAKLATIGDMAHAIRAELASHPDLATAGYTLDALKEVAEAYLTYAIVRNEALPTPEALHIDGATYWRGMSEAATELRRFILDILRRTDADFAEVERLLEWMDTIYDLSLTFDFPDAITGNLRRQTDVVRGVLERTRGDVTNSLRQQRLQDALAHYESRLGLEVGSLYTGDNPDPVGETKE